MPAEFGRSLLNVSAMAGVRVDEANLRLEQSMSNATHRIWGAALASVSLALAVFLFPSPASASGDRTPPTAPTNLRVADVSFTTVTLAWNPSTDNSGTVAYEARIDTPDNLVHERAFTTTQAFGGLEAGRTYTASVFAVDGAENASAAATIQFTTVQRTLPPPSAPTNLRGVFVNGTLHDIAWDPSVTSQLVSYVGYSGQNVLFSTSATRITIFNLVYAWCAVDPGGTYTVTIQAIAQDNALSERSTPATFIIPAAGSITR
jgi:hypothetical protein